MLLHSHISLVLVMFKIQEALIKPCSLGVHVLQVGRILVFLKTLGKYCLFWAFFTSSAVCSPQLMSSLMLTPRKRKSETLSTQTPLMWRGWMLCFFYLSSLVWCTLWSGRYRNNFAVLCYNLNNFSFTFLIFFKQKSWEWDWKKFWMVLMIVLPSGERLFSLIQNMHLSLAGKITGMLLEIHNSQLLHMLEAPESLHSKVSQRRHPFCFWIFFLS